MTTLTCFFEGGKHIWFPDGDGGEFCGWCSKQRPSGAEG